VCSYSSFPELKWVSADDRSNPTLGLVCAEVQDPPAGFGPTNWYRLGKLLRLVDALPFL
jgi:hypothetical protein